MWCACHHECDVSSCTAHLTQLVHGVHVAPHQALRVNHGTSWAPQQVQGRRVVFGHLRAECQLLHSRRVQGLATSPRLWKLTIEARASPGVTHRRNAAQHT